MSKISVLFLSLGSFIAGFASARVCPLRTMGLLLDKQMHEAGLPNSQPVYVVSDVEIELPIEEYQQDDFRWKQW